MKHAFLGETVRRVYSQ